MKHGDGPQLCMANMECLAGFEPVPSAWKAEMLPLNTTDTFPYGASLSLVWDAGIEPAWIYPADFEAAASTCFANPRCPSDPFLTGRCDMIFWVRESDSNRRLRGYGPRLLPLQYPAEYTNICSVQMFKNMRSFWNAISFDCWPCGLHLVPQGLFGGKRERKRKCDCR